MFRLVTRAHANPPPGPLLWSSSSAMPPHRKNVSDFRQDLSSEVDKGDRETIRQSGTAKLHLLSAHCSSCRSYTLSTVVSTREDIDQQPHPSAWLLEVSQVQVPRSTSQPSFFLCMCGAGAKTTALHTLGVPSLLSYGPDLHGFSKFALTRLY